MELNINKVEEYISKHGGLNWIETCNGDVIQDDNMVKFINGNHELTFRVSDNSVNMTLISHPLYDEEHYTMTREYIYDEDKVRYKYSIDKEYYEDKRDRSDVLRHSSLSYNRELDKEKIMPLTDLYTPSKIK